MTSRFPKSMHYFLIAAILVVAVLAVPSTNAKYAKESKYNINIETRMAGVFERIIATTSTSAQSVTLQKAGRYLIIVKGGDGSDGRGNDSSSNNYADFTILGGLGGTLKAIVTTPSNNQSLYIAPGSGGNRPANDAVLTASWGTTTKAATIGAGGTNSGAGKYGGGAGNSIASRSSEASTLYNLNNGLKTSSGGGGAASVIYAGNNNRGTVLMIAGGGGAAGCHHQGWDGYTGNFGGLNYKYTLNVYEGGAGGNGGSNNNSSSSVNVGLVFNGDDGQRRRYTSISENDANYRAYGGGGTTAAGQGANLTNISQIISASTGSNGNTSIGTNGNGTGTGAGGAGKYIGGGGGGGYCGGGGGTGCSIGEPVRNNAVTPYTSSGGGGGGSSFIRTNVSAVSQISSVTYSFNASEEALFTRAMNDVKSDSNTTISNFYNNNQRAANATTPLSPSAANTHVGDGYIIIYYLGPAT